LISVATRLCSRRIASLTMLVSSCVEENVVLIREEDPGVAAKLSLVERSQRLVKDPRQVGRIREDRTDVQSTQQ
jgi:hypothetical protein